MDQGNLAILVDAKFEYTKQLINILKNNLFQGIKKIYNDAKEYSIEHDESDRTLKKFQFYLSEIPKWNQEMILSQVSDILEKSKCDWLEELITAVFVSHTRILTSINSGKAKKKINLNIPKIDHFIHQCYIDTARAFWKNPYLFDDTLNNYEYQRNRREAEGIIETSIQETIRKQLPVKHILKEYLGKDYETDDEEENIESEDYSNLRKMVKAEIENCSKDPNKKLKLIKKLDEVEVKERKKPKYTPLSKRQDRPDAILWLCKNASDLTDGQISKLVGSTKGTVSLIRKRSYWNFSNLKPRDPVILALCTQEAFQKSLEKAKRRVEREKKAKLKEEKKQREASL